MRNLATKIVTPFVLRRLALLTAMLLLIWTPASSQAPPAPPGARPGETLTMLPDGRWLHLGGVDAAGAALGSATIVDASGVANAQAWQLSAPRAHHTATVLPDGHVLVLGGVTTG